MMSGSAATTISLDNPENLRSVARELIVERIGWVVTAFVLIIAVLGFLGRGPFGYRKIASDDGRFVVEYYATERYEAPARLTIHFDDVERPDRLIRIAISREFADEITPEYISPEPESTIMLSHSIVHAFRVSDLRDGGQVTYRYKYGTWGWRRFSVALVDGPNVEVSQFVCP